MLRAFTVKMMAECFPETSVNFYHTLHGATSHGQRALEKAVLRREQVNMRIKTTA
jgi:hypothetical protein